MNRLIKVSLVALIAGAALSHAVLASGSDAPPVPYVVAPVAASGTIAGVITTDQPGTAVAMQVTQDMGVCGQTIADPSVIVTDKRLANAVVWIDGLTTGAAAAPVEATLDQRTCMYVPHVQAVAKGSKLTVINSDGVLHNAHSTLDGSRTVFNLAMPTKDQRITTDLRRSGLMSVKCDAGHTWMSAYIWVFDHPYFAVTGADGTFAIPGVPAGDHTLRVWHEKLGTKDVPVTVAANGKIDVKVNIP